MKRRGANCRVVLEEVAALKAQRRRCMLKCTAALVLAIAALICKIILESQGIVASDDAFIGGAVTLFAMVACVYAGTASIEASRCKKAISDTIARNELARKKTGRSGRRR